ncbi:hypothetical protein BGZ76_002573 [Entomortierella beljakovae]|nr:hypothetical protein BGZ76_002573 [Entomortierella beljakovae]
MAASLDTPTSHHNFTQEPSRNKRSLSSPALVIASLRGSFSQVSLQDEQQSQYKSHSNTLSPTTAPITSRSNRTRSLDQKSQSSTLNGQPSKDPKFARNSMNQDSKSTLPQLQIPFKMVNNSQSKQTKVVDRNDNNQDESYFGDILDKYCTSDEDPASPSTASPTSPFSTTHNWSDFKSPQPPTPPVNSNRHSSHRRATPLRNTSTPFVDTSSGSISSPMLAASARFNTYLQSTSNGTISPVSSSPSSPASPSTITRVYSRRPAPVPGSTSSNTSSTSNSPVALSPDTRETKPTPPPKDIHRPISNAQFNNNDISGSQLPLQQSHSFTSVVEESMRRNKTNSVSSFSPSISGSINPYANNAVIISASPSGVPVRAHSSPNLLNYSSQQHNLYSQGKNGHISPTSNSNTNDKLSYYQQQQQWLQQQQWPDQKKQQPAESSYFQIQPSNQQRSSASYNSPPLTPSEMLSRRFDHRLRSPSMGSISSASKYSASLPGVKSALVKNPIAHSQSKEMDDRKVNFGDMITIVTVERAESPPPPSPEEVKKYKKKFKKGSKTGPHPDPEYNDAFYSTPYTPVPAEVVITQVPWIDNPNYDEEKQNSKFYYEDEYDEDEGDHEYNAAQSIPWSPIEEDEEEEDEEDDEFSTGGRMWGNGIAGGANSEKKKGGLFKFKRAVNRLLRN